MPRKKTDEEFREEVKVKGEGEYTYKGKYTKSVDKLLFTHLTCGTEYKVAPRDFSSGRRCPACQRKVANSKINKSHEDFKERFYAQSDGSYTLLTKYENARTKVKVRHEECGSLYEVTPAKFLSGRRCPYCKGKAISSKLRKTQSDFESSVYSIHGDSIKVIGEYKSRRLPILLKHEKCGHEYMTVPDSVLGGNGCPRCRLSKGESRIAEFMQKEGIEYISQKTFDDCKNKAKLPFDFSVEKDGEVLFLIEYQGIQHYQPVDFFGGGKYYKERVVLDSIKSDFCEQKQIPLMKIPYYEEIEDYLVKIKELYANPKPS